jgi:large conductance mechanosensitive channel
MLKGFKDFIMRGNVIDLSIAVVMGAAFSSVVTAFTTKIVQPLLNTFSPPSSQGLGIALTSGKSSTYIDFSALITAGLNFILVAGVVYFAIVLPMRTIQQRRKRGEEAGPAEPTDIELLKEIRDLLKGGSGAIGGSRPGSVESDAALPTPMLSTSGSDFVLDGREPELFTQPGSIRSTSMDSGQLADQPTTGLSGPAVPAPGGLPPHREAAGPPPTRAPGRAAEETAPVGEYSVGSMGGEWRQIAPGPGGGSVGPVSGRPPLHPDEEPDWHPGPAAAEREGQHERRSGLSRRRGTD